MKIKVDSGIVNLDEGKKIFFDYYGNALFIDREVPEYQSYNVPKEIEATWTKVIIKDLNQQISELKGDQRYKLITILSAINDYSDQANLLYNIVEEQATDTFLKILCLEDLAKLRQTINNVLKHNYKDIRKMTELSKDILSKINIYKSKLVDYDITIDESFINAYYLKYYDFSDDNLRKRIIRI